ncbi:Holliday junction resolvase [Thioalkalivibrio paradoxus ARh 1]|uniref:Putative pre-16S rRNA nuclease n=2 Tax=Thioalkalivibrio paradoxus TaxID=108010 RepID=W0DQK6_9GAMM|nr:Holliday junction resolvase [Thioalkalivibrio paradoxus ARh 1]
MAFDYGRRRIGIAVGESLTGRARGLQTLATNQPGLQERLRALVAEWRPDALVVGWPTRDDGQATALGPAIRSFGEMLGREFGLPVYWADERLSSHLGRERIQRRRRDPGLDAHAAAVILEGWLTENTRNA